MNVVKEPHYLHVRTVILASAAGYVQPGVSQRRQAQIGGEGQPAAVVLRQLVQLAAGLQVPVQPEEMHGCREESKASVSQSMRFPHP